MKKSIMLIGLALMALIAIAMTLFLLNNSTIAARPARLVVTGSDGQHISGKYVADGFTNTVSAITPVTISFAARNIDFEFKQEGGEIPIRIDLYVCDLQRLSTTTLQGARGSLRYSAASECYWAVGF